MNRSKSKSPPVDRLPPTLEPEKENNTASTGLLAPTRLAWLAVAMLCAVLTSTTLMTADSVSVFDGESLPQVLMILLAALVAGLAGRSAPSAFPLNRSVFLCAGICAMLLISTLAAAAVANGRASWNGFWHVLALLLFGACMRQGCQSPSASRAILQLVLACAIFQSTYGLHQYFISMPAARAAYQRDPDGELAKAGIDAPAGSPVRLQYESRLLNSFEPSATFALTNSLAVLLSGAIVAFGLLIVRAGVVLSINSPTSASSRQWLGLILAIISWLAVAIVWLLTKSRTGVLAVVVMTVLVSFVMWRVRKVTRTSHSASASGPDRRWIPAWIALGTATVALIFGFMLMLLSRDTLILSEAPKSVAYRLEYWQATARLILDYPWTGVGLGNFQSYYPRYKLPQASEIIADPHNWLFDVAACLSMPMLILVLIGLAILLWSSWNTLAALAGDEFHPSIDTTSGSTTRDPSDNATSPLSKPLTFHGWLAALKDHNAERAVWIGATSGWLITAMLQLLSHESIDLDASVLGLATAIAGCFAMRQLPLATLWTIRAAALSASCTMLLALLASGSWQASGLSMPMAALLAVACPASYPVTANERAVKASSWRALAPVLVMLLTLAGFLLQTWQPVNTSWAAAEQAASQLRNGDFERARLFAELSVAADPIASEPRRMLIQIDTAEIDSLTTGQQDRLRILSQKTKDNLESFLQSNPQSNLNWSYASQVMLTLAAAARRLGEESIAQESLIRSAEMAREATQRHPSSVALHAQLAVILSLRKQDSQSKLPLETAFSLSELTPHEDRKLAAQQVWLPKDLVTGWPTASVVRASDGSSWAQAEPLCEFLRNQ